MSLNSKWFQKYKPSKLINRKNVRFSTKTDVFYLSTLMAHLYLDVEAEGHNSTFTFCHAQLKKAILLPKRAIGPLLLLFCVIALCIN